MNNTTKLYHLPNDVNPLNLPISNKKHPKTAFLPQKAHFLIIPINYRHVRINSRHVPNDSRHVQINSRHVRNNSRHVRNNSRHIRNNSRHVRNDSRHVRNNSRHVLNNSRHVRNDYRHAIKTNENQLVSIYPQLTGYHFPIGGCLPHQKPSATSTKACMLLWPTNIGKHHLLIC